MLYAPATDLARGALLQRGGEKENAVRNLLFALVAIASIIMSTPASAQVWFDAGPVGVRVGPPPWGWHRRHWVREYAYVVPACRMIRERIRTPRGRLIVREREVCD